MGKVIIISFFKSNNIGDLALSNAIETIISKQGFNVKKYDFANIEPIETNNNRVFENKYSTNKDNSNRLIKLGKKIIREVLNFLFGEYTVGSFSSYIRKRTNWKNYIKDLDDVDSIIIGGGNMIMDTHYDWPSIFYRYCKLANKYNKKIHVAFVGAEPPKYKKSRILYKKAFHYSTSINVRDPISKAIVEDLTNKKVEETIDPVFYLKPSLKKGKKYESKSIGINILSRVCFKNDEEYISYTDSIIKLIKKLTLIDSYSLILFSTDTIDWPAIQELENHLLQNKIINISISLPTSLNDIYELYDEFDYIIGGRMHAMIIAQKCLLPFMGVIWQSKVKGFAMVVDSCDRLFNLTDLTDTEQIIKCVLIDLNNISKVKEKMYKKNLELERIIEEQRF
ncbi:polysaccharide pyruvyl transferase family protein [Neobacillus sp. OS1-2]|uniref:polysaccharide pyruvyl transferase family protein n=1 Tax=Neobacillus sp. OS1-2 TaxID=3070680 RepID=UPI0027E08731|nr:polysaccharide pyruvyl transferase family protein [Neobacillus sp. OS1-2]WML41537.1 polysaccharide pyruvyl transferase family protein [Neobacillus sp. OS1-2]